jgi:hypothetical protein
MRIQNDEHEMVLRGLLRQHGIESILTSLAWFMADDTYESFEETGESNRTILLTKQTGAISNLASEINKL